MQLLLNLLPPALSQLSKRALSALCLLVLLAGPARAAQTNAWIDLGWKWFPTNSLGGLSMADYLTNVTFQIYASTNLAFTEYTPYATLYSTNITYTAPSNFVATVPGTTNQFLFFTATVVTAGGESPFSNLVPILPIQPPGSSLSAKGRK